jgi:hypothetical protein
VPLCVRFFLNDTGCCSPLVLGSADKLVHFVLPCKEAFA